VRRPRPKKKGPDRYLEIQRRNLRGSILVGKKKVMHIRGDAGDSSMYLGLGVRHKKKRRPDPQKGIFRLQEKEGENRKKKKKTSSSPRLLMRFQEREEPHPPPFSQKKEKRSSTASWGAGKKVRKSPPCKGKKGLSSWMEVGRKLELQE